MIIIRSLPPQTTRYFAVILNTWEINEEGMSTTMNSDLESVDGYGPLNVYNSPTEKTVLFRFYFANLVGCSISACFSIHSSPEQFTVVDQANQDLHNHVLELFIVEEEDGHYAIVNPPMLKVSQ